MANIFRSLSLALICGLSFAAAGQTNDLSGANDASIRNVLTVVGNRQLRTSAAGSTPLTLADGDYPVSTFLATATGAAKPLGIEWDYPWGVNLYGLLQAYRATGNTNYLNFVLNHNLIVGRYYFWLRSLHNSLTNTAGLPGFQQSTALMEFFILDRLDYCGSMTAQLMEGILRHSGPITFEQLEMAHTTAKYIGGTQARLPDGTLWRPGSLGGTVWADDLYMSCPFLVRWYQYTGDASFLGDAAQQIINMAGYLQGTNGIWYHGYFYRTSSVNGYKWGRANGWAMVATTEVLSVMPTNHPARSNVLNILRRHIEGIKSVQAPSGRWRQVLDHPELWEETSCSAMFTYCIARAVNRGWIDPTNLVVARNGFIGVCGNITTNGVVNGTCEGTGIGTSLAFYINRTRPSDDMHGRGAVLLAGSEILLNPKLNISSAEGQATVLWNAGITNSALETGTNLTEWSTCTNLPVVNTNWQKLVIDSLSGARFYRLRLDEPAYPAPPLIYEAESLSWTTNGAVAQLSTSDTNASGNYFITLFGDSVGDYIEFTVTNVPAGTYRAKLNFKSNTNRGFVNLTVDGTPLGGTLDEYFYSTQYPLMDFGPITFNSDGDHALRFTVAGKHGASSGYTFTADRFILAPE